MLLDERTEDLFRRIRTKCQDRGWFGADAWMDSGFISRPPLSTAFPEVTTKEQLEQIEHQLTFPFPRLLRDLYLSLANGEICFGYGMLSAEHLLEEYRSISQRSCFEGAWRWPEQLLPLCYWGCTLYSYLDREQGTILFADTEGLFEGKGDFLVEAPDLSTWLNRWISKRDQFPSSAKLIEADEQWQEEEEDPQARAMGLEMLLDDPHTPIPAYVSAYRRLSRQ